MTDEASCKVSFAETCLKIEARCPNAASLLDFLFCDIRADENETADLKLRFWETRKGNRFKIKVDEPDSKAVVISDRNEAVRQLMDQTIFHLADDCSQGALLHAAAVGRHRVILLLPGQSGAGKSTLSSWFMNKGFSYFTDELVYLALSGEQMHCLTRPIIIKKNAPDAIWELLSLDRNDERFYRGPVASLVPHRLMNPEYRPSRQVPNLLIYPKYEKHAQFKLEPISSAKAAMKLMGFLVNARNLPNHGFSFISQFAQSLPAYDLTYSSFKQLDTHLDQILAGAGFSS